MTPLFCSFSFSRKGEEAPVVIAVEKVEGEPYRQKPRKSAPFYGQFVRCKYGQGINVPFGNRTMVFSMVKKRCVKNKKNDPFFSKSVILRQPCNGPYYHRTITKYFFKKVHPRMSIFFKSFFSKQPYNGPYYHRTVKNIFKKFGLKKSFFSKSKNF